MPNRTLATVKPLALVEPVNSQLPCQQNFNRFRHRGLQEVKREFALPVLAYTLLRAVCAVKRHFWLIVARYTNNAKLIGYTK